MRTYGVVIVLVVCSGVAPAQEDSTQAAAEAAQQLGLTPGLALSSEELSKVLELPIELTSAQRIKYQEILNYLEDFPCLHRFDDSKIETMLRESGVADVGMIRQFFELMEGRRKIELARESDLTTLIVGDLSPKEFGDLKRKAKALLMADELEIADWLSTKLDERQRKGFARELTNYWMGRAMHHPYIQRSLGLSKEQQARLAQDFDALVELRKRAFANLDAANDSRRSNKPPASTELFFRGLSYLDADQLLAWLVLQGKATPEDSLDTAIARMNESERRLYFAHLPVLSNDLK